MNILETYRRERRLSDPGEVPGQSYTISGEIPQDDTRHDRERVPVVFIIRVRPGVPVGHDGCVYTGENDAGDCDVTYIPSSPSGGSEGDAYAWAVYGEMLHGDVGDSARHLAPEGDSGAGGRF